MKIYIGYLDSKWIYFDEKNEVFQYQDQKNISNWIMVAAPLAVFLFEGKRSQNTISKGDFNFYS